MLIGGEKPMKMIKHGKTLKDVIFSCEQCECEFEANEFEYDIEKTGNKLYYSCACPWCSFMVHKECEKKIELLYLCAKCSTAVREKQLVAADVFNVINTSPYKFCPQCRTYSLKEIEVIE